MKQAQPNFNQASSSHITPFQLTKQIFRQEGFLGFYRGLGPTMAREMPGYFFFFGGYEWTRELLRQYEHFSQLKRAEFFICMPLQI